LASPISARQFQLAPTGCAEQPAIEIGRPKKPIGDREGQIHIHFHHQPRVMVGGMMPPQRVDEWAILDEPALVEMAAKMHEHIDQIHSRGHTHKQPADIG
jgi:hypothetical protein